MKYITQPCVRCKATSEIELSEDEISRLNAGELIQRVKPEWTPEQRELYVTGTHPECWKEIFGDEEE